ncbi:metallophosphoesterase [Cypionkella sp.]|uniref:metallophosphoesterase family protein n=1 Tax=Cypionkella sp. TaxID=2811411 RepID=UPI002715FA81|nr:metallophosphoesterase [Cypionkella sp.]MDO8982532.1 metallophosphoesterase [Cypionkella sp.]MDP2050535.1 metallophosphoesterase [Cypionkella sp.]
MALHTVAVLADVHFHDPAGDFGGAGILADGVRLALRSWADTRIAARAFNETAGVLRAALEKIAAAGVRHVVLAGDYSDDGQAANIWRLVNVLEGFEQRHGLQFYAIPGNHDLYGPHGKHVTTRFVSAPGQTMMVTSDAEQAEVGAIVTPAMRCGGQPAALLPMARFGLFRQPEYLHWESPFGLDDRPEARIYEAVSADGSATQRLMDASYLVEPEPGLWLLMIDANVFEPRAGRPDATRKKAFIGPSDAGWNAVLRVKPFLLDWIADVTARAQALGKTLVAVSHYPVLDPFQDVAGSERALFGETAIVRRTPGPQVAQALIAAGLRWHMGGHMHVNATTSTADGRLTDLSLPSLVAFPAAFKIIRAGTDVVSAETISLQDVPTDPCIAAVYTAEGRQGEALPLGALLAAQRRAHVLERRLVHDWPPVVRALVMDRDAGFLVELAGGEVAAFAGRHGLDLGLIVACPLADLIADAYLIKVAGPLAGRWIVADRLALCRALAADYGDASADPAQGPRGFLQRFLSVLKVSLDRVDVEDGPILLAAAGLSRAGPPEYPAAD